MKPHLGWNSKVTESTVVDSNWDGKRRPSLKTRNYLDPAVALKETDHPSAKWAGIELQPIKPRE